MSNSYVRTGLDLLSRVFTKRINLDRARGYDDVANSARVSPLAIISDDLKYFDGTVEVAEATLNLVSSFYLKALPMSQEIGGAEVTKTLRRLSPDPKGRVDYGKITSKAAKYVVPSLLDDSNFVVTPVDDSPHLGFGDGTLSLEADTPKFIVEDNKAKQLDANSPIEKHVDISINTTGGKVSVPLTLTLSVHYVTRAVAEDLFTGKTVKDTFTERYYAWRSGAISALDFIFAIDMVKKRKKIMIEDKTGIYKEIQERREAGWAVAAVEGFHLGEATNAAIMSVETANMIAKKHYGNITSSTVRDKMFSDMSLMVLAIVDREDEFVQFYYRNLAMGTRVPMKALKRVNSKGGPDIAEVLKAMNSGSKVTF